MGDPIIRIAGRDDIEGIVELQKHIYYEYKRDNPFFTWQCFENVNPSVLIVAEQDASIVGTFGIQKVKTAGNIYGGQLSWIIVAEHKRRTGLFDKMSHVALKCIPDLDFIFIFANENAVAPCEKILGMKFIGKLCQLILKNDSSGICTGSYAELININTKFNNLPCSRDTITFLRTEGYRRWRYANSTVYKYFKVSIPSGEYAIIKLFYGTPSEQKILGDIVDFECNNLDISRLKLLFCAASYELRNMGATVVTTWAVPGSVLRRLLEDMGFVGGEHCSFFGVKTLNSKYSQLYSFSDWHIVQSDASNY